MLQTILRFSFAFGLLTLVGACGSTSQAPQPRVATIALPSVASDKPTELPGLHNVVAYTPTLLSGAQPDGPKAFETLANMGVRTIISVDGGRPDVDSASAFGIRYVHLPIGYDGIDETRKLELARAVAELEGPIYLHCHHGKHRSAGAAAAVAVSLGQLDNATATARMKVSGTAANYKGLWACASDTRPVAKSELAKASNAFPSVWKTSGLIDGMVAIDASNDELKVIEKASWGVPTTHPDLVPTSVAGNLEGQLRGLLDDPETLAKPQEFCDLLVASAEAAAALESGLAAKKTPEELSGLFKGVAQSCKDCHSKYRD